MFNLWWTIFSLLLVRLVSSVDVSSDQKAGLFRHKSALRLGWRDFGAAWNFLQKADTHSRSPLTDYAKARLLEDHGKYGEAMSLMTSSYQELQQLDSEQRGRAISVEIKERLTELERERDLLLHQAQESDQQARYEVCSAKYESAFPYSPSNSSLLVHWIQCLDKYQASMENKTHIGPVLVRKFDACLSLLSVDPENQGCGTMIKNYRDVAETDFEEMYPSVGLFDLRQWAHVFKKLLDKGHIGQSNVFKVVQNIVYCINEARSDYWLVLKVLLHLKKQQNGMLCSSGSSTCPLGQVKTKMELVAKQSFKEMKFGEACPLYDLFYKFDASMDPTPHFEVAACSMLRNENDVAMLLAERCLQVNPDSHSCRAMVANIAPRRGEELVLKGLPYTYNVPAAIRRIHSFLDYANSTARKEMPNRNAYLHIFRAFANQEKNWKLLGHVCMKIVEILPGQSLQCYSDLMNAVNEVRNMALGALELWQDTLVFNTSSLQTAEATARAKHFENEKNGIESELDNVLREVKAEIKEKLAGKQHVAAVGIEEAKAKVKDLVHIFQDDQQIWGQLAELSDVSMDWATAAEANLAVLRLDPTNSTASSRISTLWELAAEQFTKNTQLGISGKVHEALAQHPHLWNSTRSSQEVMEFWYRHAVLQLRTGRGQKKQDAVDLLEGLSRDNNHPAAKLELSKLTEDMADGHYTGPQKIELLRTSLQYHRRPEVDHKLGRAYLASTEYGNAAKHILAALDKEPENEQYQEALDNLLASIDSKDAQAMNVGDVGTAIERLLLSLTAEDQIVQWRRKLVDLYSAGGSESSELCRLHQALESMPPPAADAELLEATAAKIKELVANADSLKASKDIEGALKLYSRLYRQGVVCTSRQVSGQVAYSLAQVYHELKQLGPAFKHYQDAYYWDKSNPRYRSSVAEIAWESAEHVKSSNIKQASRLYELALEFNDDQQRESLIHRAAGQAYQAAGLHAKAVLHFAACLKASPSDSVCYEHLQLAKQKQQG